MELLFPCCFDFDKKETLVAKSLFMLSSLVPTVAGWKMFEFEKQKFSKLKNSLLEQIFDILFSCRFLLSDDNYSSINNKISFFVSIFNLIQQKGIIRWVRWPNSFECIALNKLNACRHAQNVFWTRVNGQIITLKWLAKWAIRSCGRWIKMHCIGQPSVWQSTTQEPPFNSLEITRRLQST